MFIILIKLNIKLAYIYNFTMVLFFVSFCLFFPLSPSILLRTLSQPVFQGPMSGVFLFYDLVHRSLNALVTSFSSYTSILVMVFLGI